MPEIRKGTENSSVYIIKLLKGSGECSITGCIKKVYAKPKITDSPTMNNTSL